MSSPLHFPTVRKITTSVDIQSGNYSASAYRMTKPPYIVEGLALGLGYWWAMLRRLKRPISRELMKFHRQEQMRKLGAVLKSLLTFKRVDNFKLLSE